jgi:uncharacterized protein (TIGR03067 family)
MVRIFSVTGILCIITAALAQSDDSAKDLQRMEGTWTGTFIEAGGKPLPDNEKAIKIKLVVKADKYTVYISEMKYTEGHIKLDAAKQPRAIDAIPADGPFKGAAQPGIYQFEGDEMRVLFSKPGAERPAEFKTKEGTEQMLALYKRVKDAK